LAVYGARDLNSTVICHVPAGSKISLGEAEEFESREWMEATLDDGSAGYILGASARGHTTLDAASKSLALESEPKVPGTFVCPDCDCMVNPVRPTPGSRVAFVCPKGHPIYEWVPCGLRGFLTTAAVFGTFYFATYFVPSLSDLSFGGLQLNRTLLFLVTMFLRCGMLFKGLYFNLSKGGMFARRPQPTKGIGLQMLQRMAGFLTGFLLAAILAGLLYPPKGWVTELPFLIRILLQTASMPQ
jgi:hypothetical protein